MASGWGSAGSPGPGHWGVQPLPSGKVSSTPRAFATTDGDVCATALLGNVLYIGGSFTHVITTDNVSHPYSHLAALDATTGDPIPGWRADTDNNINGCQNGAAVLTLALSPDNSRLYVGGGFVQINGSGSNHRHVAALDPATGTVVSTWTPVTDNSVWAIAASNTAVYVGGDFQNANGQTATKVAALDTVTGARIPGWNVGVDNNPPYNQSPQPTPSPAYTDGRIQALTLSADGSKLYLGGYINHVWHLGQSTDSVPRPGAAAVSTADGKVDSNFQPAFLSGPKHEGMDPFQILVGNPGHLYVAIGGLRNVLFDVNPLTGATIWADTASNDFQTITLFNKYLYAGGHIHKFVKDAAGQHTAVEGIRVNPNTGLMDTSWTPGFGPVTDNQADKSYFGVWTMLATTRGLYAGGAFQRAGGVSHPHLAFYPAA